MSSRGRAAARGLRGVLAGVAVLQQRHCPSWPSVLDGERGCRSGCPCLSRDICSGSVSFALRKFSFIFSLLFSCGC